MSSIDYALSESSLRRALSKLSKTKLIKECKAKKVKFTGSKQEMIRRLLDKTKKSKAPKNSIRFNSAKLISKKGEKLIKELNRMTQVLLYNPHGFDKDFMNDSSHQSILKQLKDLALDNQKRKQQVAAFYCFDTMMRLYYIVEKNEHEYDKVCKQYKYYKIGRTVLINFANIRTIEEFNIAQIMQHSLDFNQWVKTLKNGDKIDIYHMDVDKITQSWNIGEILEIKKDQKENIMLLKYRQIIYAQDYMHWSKRNAVYEKKIDLNPKINIVDREILPLNTKTVWKNLYREKLGQKTQCLGRTQCLCFQCLFIMDKNEIKSHVESNITFKFPENLMDIIAEFAVGHVIGCCNERDQCDNEIFLHDEKPWNPEDGIARSDSSVYYSERVNVGLKYNEQFKIRIFCESCTTTILRCCKTCSRKEVLNEDGVCGIHSVEL